MHIDHRLYIDSDLEKGIDKRLEQVLPKLIVVGTGITSSHLGDERNLREFLFAAEVTRFLRAKNYNVFFMLADDSYDALDFRQLRVAVNKNEELIAKFEKYCGMPLKFIPDPFACHDSYSAHFQNEILKRFNDFGIFPNIIDSYSAYASGLYDAAKEIVFSRHEEIKAFLKQKFPSYTMKKLFYPVCPDCKRMAGVEKTEISGAKIHIHCTTCQKSSTHLWKQIPGKFSWKIDEAIKWNVYKTDFEPFSKAYLDPDVGSFYIAKALSETFFGGNVPEVIEYGQVIMDKSFSYTLLNTLPLPAFRSLYLERRKADIQISLQKIIHVAKQHLVEKELSFYDYVHERLPYDLLEHLNGQLHDPFWQKLLHLGLEFNRRLLKREMYPQLPALEALKLQNAETLGQIRSLILWTLTWRRQPNHVYTDFSNHYQQYLKDHKIQKSALFPILRKLLSQEQGVPVRRLLYFAPLHYLYACLALIDETKEVIAPLSVK
ncbi:MAG: Lysine-tRNA ligase [Candidatus Gottesmanbacteria bacterium GW2011_GWB1_43_11]|uniref:Lysine-tRNA ligase n=1 Tax=Candidatus Gottesmanbacteria bacterium GW2011_GWB1_43_11 TaxID=1618446 RepID=A0A0G1FIZ1_9BACT|nr:MAG: Lysine-tRNA ligase [Candidatus Gottesmanbacteria bacterium GW2011_GWA2_42_16]KKS55410.1 MAG: Lysine-tRNA ligase [Candidatus Gottesmanbacteria bacterium GW2011_GWA1_42_26]KKS81888.1 MAG: Lysine-tRNA ligase [Candidatus Gottesmanbacteria bacterium GW2011_GWC1_43_10]KKS86808.1 MAG: Lysine-tRNA ligase [Candidatus Gottesmanbacteria bacterium GW2011_GWB1_43_11]OGG10602.1 MAG: hypothetical protein A2699_01785 [Candidatus Gottesmanbacteria bacterium RIFCSPHIGHO2_01_FULL_43_15]OGG27706.1 MAG: hy